VAIAQANRLFPPAKVKLELVSPFDLVPKHFTGEVRERLGIKGFLPSRSDIKKEKKGGEKNKKTARKERLNLVETEKVSLCRLMIISVITFYKHQINN